MSRTVTGIQPSGTPHLGNYLGMIQPALELARHYEAFFFIADYHALTRVQDPERLRQLTGEVAATLLALGLEPSRTVLYRQSDLPEVCELACILACRTPKGLLNRAHAYKAAIADNRLAGRGEDAGITMGLYNYPLLMPTSSSTVPKWSRGGSTRSSTSRSPGTSPMPSTRHTAKSSPCPSL